MFIRKDTKIIKLDGFSESKKEELIDGIVDRLMQKDFNVINKTSSQIDFVRKQVGKNEVGDKFAIYRKIQYSGKYRVEFSEGFLKVFVKLNFGKQLILLLLAVVLPLLLFSFVYGSLPWLMIFFFLFITFVWFEVCIVLANNISNTILRQSMDKFERNVKSF